MLAVGGFVGFIIVGAREGINVGKYEGKSVGVLVESEIGDEEGMLLGI